MLVLPGNRPAGQQVPCLPSFLWQPPPDCFCQLVVGYDVPLLASVEQETRLVLVGRCPDGFARVGPIAHHNRQRAIEAWRPPVVPRIRPPARHRLLRQGQCGQVDPAAGEGCPPTSVEAYAAVPPALQAQSSLHGAAVLCSCAAGVLHQGVHLQVGPCLLRGPRDGREGVEEVRLRPAHSSEAGKGTAASQVLARRASDD